MNKLKLGLREERVAFEPGEEIAGAAQWELEEAPERVEVRLFFYTRGKGTADVEVAEKVEFEAPAAGEVRTFSFVTPEGPPSFSGQLISVLWAVELLVTPGELCERVEITIGPGGREVELPPGAGALRAR